MIQSVTTATSAAALNTAAKTAAPANSTNTSASTTAPVAKPLDPKAVEQLKALNQKAYLERQQIAAALYDRSFTYDEGVKALKRQDAIAAYAAKIQTKAGGPTQSDLDKLALKLERAAKQIERLSNNRQGADLNSVAAVDGKPVDDTQANLARRIETGLRDGSLTQDEAKVLIEQQDKISELEKGLRESGGKLTAGEQKIVLDELRKSADAINKARANTTGVSVSTFTYADAVNKRQDALEKQLEQGLKIGSLTEEEAATVRAQFDTVNAAEQEALANGSVNWREATALSSLMNEAEAQIYELQRNDAGKKLAEVYVDEKYVDERQTGQLESITRGIDNRSLTNEEASSLLLGQKAVDEQQAAAAEGGLTRAEYLRLQSTMNDQSLSLNTLATNAARYTGLVPPPPPVATPAPVAPAPVAGANGNGAANGGTAANGNGAAQPAPAPVAPAPAANGNGTVSPAPVGTPVSAAPVAAAPTPAPAPAQPVAEPEVAKKAEEASPAAQEAAETKAETAPTLPQINKEMADTKDILPNLLSKALEAHRENIARFARELAEKADKARDEAHRATERRSDDRHEGIKAADKPGEAPRADIAHKVASYARTEAPSAPAAPVLAKKIA